MRYQIRKVAVLGAGVMGSGIAGHLANAGVPCLMLDIVPPQAAEGEDTSSKSFRNRFAANAMANFRKQKPAPLVRPDVAGLIEIGNFDDDLHRIAECDWVVEVVKEDMAVKQALFAKVEQHLAPNAIVSSNTSGLSIKGMTEGRSESFRKRFLVTHFFNPVRYMKLLELVAGEETDQAVVEAIHEFGEGTLGKGIVYGKDTTNFIGNRIGVYGMMKTLQLMNEDGMSIEEIDRIFGKAMGRPNSAVFRTADVVGLDTFIHVSKNCYDTLDHDEERDVFGIPSYLQQMVAKGLLGAKNGKGFYQRVKGADGRKVNQVLNLETLEYEDPKPVEFDSLKASRKIEDVRERVKAVMSFDDRGGRFAEKVSLAVLAYSSRRIPEIADDVVNVDRGLRWGFGWELGPFELWDAIGVQHGVERMKAYGFEPAQWVLDMLAAGRTSFYAIDGVQQTYWDIPAKAAKVVPESSRVLKVEYLKRAESNRIDGNLGATLWDMGQGVALLELHTKMNAIDGAVIEMMNKAVDRAEQDFKGLVVGHDGDTYSAGANLGAIMMGVQMQQFGMVEDMVRGFQAANQRLRYSSIPVVTAPHGLSLGGGTELAMAGNAMQASSELFMGLVEFGVGLIPGGGGNLQLLRNLYGPFAMDPDIDAFPFIKKVFLAIGMARVSSSAEDARSIGFLKPSDNISMNRDFVLSDARALAIGMADSGFRAPRQTGFLLPGPSGRATVEMLLYDMKLNGQISAHDEKIGRKLANVLCGGETSPTAPVSEERLLELELEAFMSLVGEKLTQDRMEHMLKTGKPLRN